MGSSLAGNRPNEQAAGYSFAHRRICTRYQLGIHGFDVLSCHDSQNCQ